jgi:hypothetical protein
LYFCFSLPYSFCFLIPVIRSSRLSVFHSDFWISTTHAFLQYRDFVNHHFWKNRRKIFE